MGFLAVLSLFCFLALAPPGSDIGVFANQVDDKTGHFAAFLLLGPLAAAAYPRIRISSIFLVLLLMGAAMEYGQTLTGREASLDDVLANVLGLLAGMFPLAVYRMHLARNAHGRRRDVDT